MIDIEKLEDLVAGDYLTESMKELMIQQRDEVRRLRNKNINYIKLIDDITLWIAKSPYESDYIIAYVDEKMSEIHLGVEEE